MRPAAAAEGNVILAAIGDGGAPAATKPLALPRRMMPAAAAEGRVIRAAIGDGGTGPGTGNDTGDAGTTGGDGARERAKVCGVASRSMACAVASSSSSASWVAAGTAAGTGTTAADDGRPAKAMPAARTCVPSSTGRPAFRLDPRDAADASRDAPRGTPGAGPPPTTTAPLEVAMEAACRTPRAAADECGLASRTGAAAPR